MMISVIGSSNQLSQTTLDQAEAIGRELALRGAIIICDGLYGVAAAVCRGAKSESGVTIGILPGNDPVMANPWIDIPICTGIGYACNLIVIKSGQAVIAIDGEFDTLSEIGSALAHGKAVIGLNTWSFQKKGQNHDSIILAQTPSEAVNRAIEVINRQMAAEFQ